jgi:hypothetical protein
MAQNAVVPFGELRSALDHALLNPKHVALLAYRLIDALLRVADGAAQIENLSEFLMILEVCPRVHLLGEGGKCDSQQKEGKK